MSIDAAHVDELIRDHLADGHTAGLAVVVTDASGVLLERYAGDADIAAGTPVDAATLFPISSITKVATAILAVRAWERGLIDLDAPARAALPWLPEPFDQVTPRELLSHTSGLAAGNDLAPTSPYMAYAANNPDSPLGPRGEFHYSDAGFQVLGMIVAALAGKPYPELLADDLMAPLGMRDSTPTITSAMRRRMAVAYQPSPDDRPLAAGDGLAPAPWFSYGAADGSMVCSGRDLAAFARLLLTRGAGVLSERGFDVLTTPVADTGDDEDVCLGVFRGRKYGYTDLNHGGSMVGHESMLCADPDTGVAVVTLGTGAGDSVPLARAVLAAARASRLGEPLPVVTPRVAPELAHYVGSYGSMQVSAAAGTLELDGVRMVWLRGDVFAVRDSPFTARFTRDAAGTVDGLTHGPRSSRPQEPCPPQWRAYPGCYRASKPFEPVFRMIVRDGAPLLCGPGGSERPLTPTADPAVFAVHGPETLRFDTIVDGRALRVSRSGCPYYRVDE